MNSSAVATTTTTRATRRDSPAGGISSGRSSIRALARGPDYGAKNIVVIGSGATAVTACAGWRTRALHRHDAAALTHLPSCRSQTDGIAEKLNLAAGDHGLHRVRWNVLRLAPCTALRSWPRRMRKMF